MTKPKVAKVVVGLPVEGPFDYAVGSDIGDDFSVGQRVWVSFNRRNRVGYVVGTAERSSFKKLNPILALLDEGPALDKHALELLEAFRSYYGCSLGEAIEAYLPAALRRDKVRGHFAVTPAAVGGPAVPQQNNILVHDQTRHQRWAFMMEHIKKTMAEDKNVIVLVPEVSFIEEAMSWLTKDISAAIAVLEKKTTPKQELALWERMKRGEFRVVVGTRSAVFAPLPRVGLIVINEEENEAYKQEQSPHYHVHEVAQMRRAVESSQVMFIGSVPSAEIWERAGRQKWEKVVFEKEDRTTVQVIDMNNYNPGKTSILSFPLQNAVQKTLEGKGKIILFMNSRGSSTRTRCQQCGFTLRCDRCDVNLSFLYSRKVMVCRHCNFERELPKMCPRCQGAYLRSSGTGIEKLENEAARLYPGARVGRYDSESAVFPDQADIIVATQAVLRRHGAWTAALVAVLNFDARLHRVDFRSGQKAFSLLMRLKSLAGEKLLVQTYMADNYCIKAARTADFEAFYREELKSRKELALPPYRHLVALGLRGENEEVVFELSNNLYRCLQERKTEHVEVLDPHPDINPKLRDQYRFTILLKGRSVKSILSQVKSSLKDFKRKNVIITVNVDP
jgi:primosomal protein N' (replication factor Y)